MRFADDFEPGDEASVANDRAPEPARSDERDAGAAATGLGPEGAQPKVFVRTISVVAGAPWDQTRSASLEARHGAPLPIADVVYQLQRLAPWRPGVAGRFAAFYVLAREVDGRLDVTAQVDGRSLAVTFRSAHEQQGRLKSAGLAAACVAAVVAVSVVATAGALTRRQQAEEELFALEERAAARLRILRRDARQLREGPVLPLAVRPGPPLKTAVSELIWAARAKSPDARFEAVRWRPAAMVVEMRGERPPFVSVGQRVLKKAEAPLRRGVWAWAVSPAAVGAIKQEPRR